jgi:Ca2+-binding RTX toxin-like protein
MGGRLGSLLLTIAVILLITGCAGEQSEDREHEPAAERSSTTTSPTEPAAPSEDPAALPTKGEPGFEDLPTCFGRRATILGTHADDQIQGTRREDVIVTRAGDDTVVGLRREDRVCTGMGDDTVMDADHWQAQIRLGSGNDRVVDSRVVSTVSAGRGDDRLVLAAHSATDVVLGPGDDVLRVRLEAGRRLPWAYNSPCPSYQRAPGPMRVHLAGEWARGRGSDRLIGVRCLWLGPFGDHVVGSRWSDNIDVGAGANLVWAGSGKDLVYSNASFGEDTFYLGNGDDNVMSGVGADRVYGGPGDDFIEAAGGPDHVQGGDGDDVLHGSYRCDFGSSSGAGTVDEWGNELFGGEGDDYLAGDLGNDRIDGGPGFDKGQGGFRDGRIDWIESLERIVRC